jgi:hypothetical protein
MLNPDQGGRQGYPHRETRYPQEMSARYGIKSVNPGEAATMHTSYVLQHGYEPFWSGRSKASTDWVLVCSVALRAMAAIHLAKRKRPW